MGEGVVENPEYGLKLFRQAAHLGHAGAAYMLGECLLDGVGCERDRASALEWLLTAAELGHSLARERALVVLLGEYEQLDPDKIEEGRRAEAMKWLDGQSEEAIVNLERRHTIGAGGVARSAAIQEHRKSKVLESRDE
jgi:TPR repeat protein